MNAYSDMERELAIDAAYRELLNAPNTLARRDAWAVMRLLICGRTPEQIRRMEEAKGLR